MKSCVICAGKAGIFSKKTYDGHICKNCEAYIPMGVNFSTSDTEYLKSLYEESLKKKKYFSNTASYGSLYIDSVHNMFCISGKNKKGEPLEYGNIYSVSELLEAGLYCSDIIQRSQNNVTCNIKFKMTTERFSSEVIIAPNEKCSFRRMGNNKIEVSEPSKLTLFRSMFNQMIDNENANLIKQLEALHKLKAALSESELSREWAKGIFFFEREEDCSPEELKLRRNMLVKIFHPDFNTEFSSTEITAKINKAYKALTK